MSQYEKKYPEFKFLGAVPIDFDDLPQLGIKDLDFKGLMNEGITKLGIIFNLDDSTMPGSHWTASFVDTNDGNVVYFDSYGFQSEHRIRKFMRRAANFCKEHNGKEPFVAHNKVRHQYKGSECGIYSIRFLTRMLKGDSFEKICNDAIPDDTVNKCRKIYFK